MRKKRPRKTNLKGNVVTIETKTTIQPSDVTAVEFECAACHSVISWPLAVAKYPPTHCHCNPEKQWMTHGGDTYRALAELVGLLQRVSKMQNEPFILRLAVKNEASGLAPNAGG